jgi:GH18 family chitinase
MLLLSCSFLHRHHFDGFEADWEYPGLRGGQADDKYYLTLFFRVRIIEKLVQRKVEYDHI